MINTQITDKQRKRFINVFGYKDETSEERTQVDEAIEAAIANIESALDEAQAEFGTIKPLTFTECFDEYLTGAEEAQTKRLTTFGLIMTNTALTIVLLIIKYFFPLLPKLIVLIPLLVHLTLQYLIPAYNWSVDMFGTWRYHQLNLHYLDEESDHERS